MFVDCSNLNFVDFIFEDSVQEYNWGNNRHRLENFGELEKHNVLLPTSLPTSLLPYLPTVLPLLSYTHIFLV